MTPHSHTATMHEQHDHFRGVLHLAVFAAALGYFVDVYDLILFSIVRVASLKSLGYSGAELTDYGILLLNMQMGGMLMGGVLWGVLGDKRGRLSILFGSILLYSIANIANAYVTDINQYAALRFIAGVGLAGELGGGVTLVAEVMGRRSRGYGTMLIATFGVAGGVAAGFVAESFEWHNCYIVGGVLGIFLLLLRLSLHESGMFEHAKAKDVAHGNFFMLLGKRYLLIKYLRSIGIGMPTWFIAGALITLSPEFAKQLHIVGVVSAAKAVMFFYVGLIPGDFISGFMSQTLRSRKKILYAFFTLTLLSCIIYLNASGVTADEFYLICLLLGFSVGYWAIFVTVAAEQFGTNIRATAATTVPNFARGSTVPIMFAFSLAKADMGLIGAAWLIGAVCIGIAFLSLYGMEETFGKDLDYVEK